MREIKFRGKASHSGEWLFGYLINICGNYHILGKDDMREDGHHVAQDSDRPTWVDIETIGQFTGFFLDGVEIYEGDILECCYDRDVKKGVVVYYQGSFGLTKGNPYESFEDMHRFFYRSESGYEVIGNIHDNPELLKGGER